MLRVSYGRLAMPLPLVSPSIPVAPFHLVEW